MKWTEISSLIWGKGYLNSNSNIKIIIKKNLEELIRESLGSIEQAILGEVKITQK